MAVVPTLRTARSVNSLDCMHGKVRSLQSGARVGWQPPPGDAPLLSNRLVAGAGPGRREATRECARASAEKKPFARRLVDAGR